MSGLEVTEEALCSYLSSHHHPEVALLAHLLVHSSDVGRQTTETISRQVELREGGDVTQSQRKLRQSVI